jgi:hypothetical protein
MSKAPEPPFAESEPHTLARGEIELRAHEIYVERGGAPGKDVEDWLQAERELLEKGKKGLRANAAAV